MKSPRSSLLRFITTAALPATAALLMLTAAPAARAEDRRFAVLIGANVGEAGEARLRYAEADAERLGQTLRALGDFSADRVLLLTGVGADEVRQALIRLNERIREGADPALLFVYYSGHAEAGRLHLAGTHLATEELRALVAGSAAASRVLVIDACRSGTLTRVKGGVPAPPFQVLPELAPLPTGLALLTSSADGEDSQESDLLRGSFFTYYFNSGLMGAADLNRDARVTLGEAFAFASEETLAATMGTLAGPQHPTYRFDLGGRQDLVLTRPRPSPHRQGALEIGEPGRYVIARVDGTAGSVPVAELVARTGGARIALSPGRYQVVLRGRDNLFEGQFEVADGEVTPLSLARMDRSAYARMMRKGGGATRVNSLAVAAGLLGNVAGFAPSYVVAAGWRQDRRRFFWEARGAFAPTDAVQTPFGFEANTQLFTAVAAAGISWDHRFVTVGAGLEAGVLALYQSYRVPPAWNQIPAAPPRTFSLGVTGGPLLQVDLPLRFGGYVRVEGGLPTYFMRAERNDGSVHLLRVTTPRLLTVVGIYF